MACFLPRQTARESLAQFSASAQKPGAIARDNVAIRGSYVSQSPEDEPSDEPARLHGVPCLNEANLTKRFQPSRS